jgi:hypothetical protein
MTDDTHELTEAEARSIMRVLGKAEGEFAVSTAFPIFWTIRAADRQYRARSGTAFALDTGERMFGVTANHVLDGWRADRCTKGVGALQIGNLSFDPEGRNAIIAAHPGIDIATFQLSPDEGKKRRQRRSLRIPPALEHHAPIREQISPVVWPSSSPPRNDAVSLRSAYISRSNRIDERGELLLIEASVCPNARAQIDSKGSYSSNSLADIARREAARQKNRQRAAPHKLCTHFPVMRPPRAPVFRCLQAGPPRVK